MSSCCSLLTIVLPWRHCHYHHRRLHGRWISSRHLLAVRPCGVSSLLSNIAGVLEQINQEEEGGGRNMAVSPMQIVVSSCVVFFSYITERVPASLRYGWINFSSLSLLLLLWLPLFLLVFLDLSFSLAFSNCLCLPLSICLSVLFPEPFLLLA